ncbi:NAD(P)/FAD-dependent oxidoreductase [Luteibaculum oceani]|uniref:NADH:ubiquinone reductase (non-electrogenic) n=1 Tax=Luteibaculum oceani TaxID=1294296 RepID=A0A5C6VJY5_9FLAO|nr:NAD(P)/FAD-dependent oxidoreductase [Luteibaculum oceani]TXC85239.1 NAD(P)/FAD-dependent oxidoreductase [Luteibaculum oceani]
MNIDRRKKVIIVGAGFAGINIAKKLDPKLFDVLLMDKVNHHQFQPLFYQVATSQIEPSSISFPIRYLFQKKKHVRIRIATVQFVDTKNNFIRSDIGDFEYDILVLALGCKTNFFGNPNIEKYTLSLKSTYEAIGIRNHILQNFERIINSQKIVPKELKNLIIVGAGPTGVEMAGAFAELRNTILPKDYHRIDFSDLKVILIEGSANTLNNMSTNSKEKSKQYLDKLGVEIWTNTIVKNYDGKILETTDGKFIETNTVIWSAGVTPNSIKGLPEHVFNRGRIIVDRQNKVLDCENIYALGDLAYMETPKYPKGHPQLANVAINQALLLAENLKKRRLGKKQKDYEYKDLGSMATIGRNKAVVDLPFFRFNGFFAWIIWMFLHLMLILTVRNKLIIFINWTIAYFSRNTALRIILKDPSKP